MGSLPAYSTWGKSVPNPEIRVTAAPKTPRNGVLGALLTVPDDKKRFHENKFTDGFGRDLGAEKSDVNDLDNDNSDEECSTIALTAEICIHLARDIEAIKKMLDILKPDYKAHGLQIARQVVATEKEIRKIYETHTELFLLFERVDR